MRQRRQPASCHPAPIEPTIETAGEIFPDGKLIELVSKRASGGEVQLLFWDGDRAEVAARIENNGKVYRPIALPPGTLKAIRLPSRPAPYGSTRQLFEKIIHILATNTTLRPREQRLLAFFIIASWFPDVLSTTPCVLLRASSQAEASRLLRLLGAMCCRGLHLTGLTPASLGALPRRLRPTLLIDQLVIGRTLAGLLRSSNQPGVFMIQSGALVEMGGARVIFAANNHLEPSATRGMVNIPIPPAQRGVPIIDARAAERIAMDLQPELLEYRLRNHLRVKDSAFDATELTPEMRDVARSLGAAIVDDAELACELTELLGAQDRDARATISMLPEYAVVFSILGLVHERKLRTVVVQDLARFVNVVLRAIGEFL
jgi:hypothetical protein